MPGYSGTPLPRKLGITEDSQVYPIAAPTSYRRLVAPLPPGARLVARLTKSVDVVHLFVHERRTLARHLTSLRTRIAPTTAVWVSWPKKASGVTTDVTEDVVRAEALPHDFVDVKVCAVDEIWSGLKLVIRTDARG